MEIPKKFLLPSLLSLFLGFNILSAQNKEAEINKNDAGGVYSLEDRVITPNLMEAQKNKYDNLGHSLILDVSKKENAPITPDQIESGYLYWYIKQDLIKSRVIRTNDEIDILNDDYLKLVLNNHPSKTGGIK